MVHKFYGDKQVKGDVGWDTDDISGNVIITSRPLSKFLVNENYLVLLQQDHSFTQEWT